MFSRSTALLLCFFAFSVICGCTVKEDRTECPMPLRVVPGESAAGIPIHYNIKADGECVWNDYFICAADSSVSIEVPRKLLECFASCSRGDCYDEDGNFLIPIGKECPETWSHSAFPDARMPHVSDTVDLHRNFARITFVVKNEEKTSRKTLHGRVCGFNNDGSPAFGDFRCRDDEAGEKGSANSWTVGVPRQIDDSLTLEMEASGTTRMFPAGRYLDNSGYDWTAEDLEDVTIEIDYVGYYVRVRTCAWEHTLSFDIKF